MKFILPNIGEGIDTMSITEVLIKKEDKVTKDTPVLLVETDKASMEIPIDCDCELWYEYDNGDQPTIEWHSICMIVICKWYYFNLYDCDL